MEFSDFFDNKAKFRNVQDVKLAIKTSKSYKNEPVETAKVLNFFSTSKQKSYLVATDEMVYCIVDDARKKQPKVNWSERKSKFIEVEISTTPKTDKTSLVNFGENHKHWLCTKSIFADNTIENKVSEILSQKDST